MNKLPWTIKHMSATEQSLKSHCQVQDLCILATILCGHGGFSPDKMLQKWSGEGDRDHKVKGQCSRYNLWGQIPSSMSDQGH